MAAGALDMKATNFRETVLGEAVTSAVNDVGQKLDARAGSLPTKTVAIDGLVADVSPDGTVIINVGSRAGVKKGDTLAIKRKVREVRDPATGKVIRAHGRQRRHDHHHGRGRESAVGKFNGSQPAKVGDVVNNQ